MTGLQKLLALKATAKNGALPSDYKRVEYIKGNGAQYILVNDQFNTNVRFTLVCQAEETTDNSQIVFAQSARGGYWFGYGAGKYSVGSSVFTNVQLTDKVMVVFTYTTAGLFVNIGGVERSSSYTGDPRGLTIFGAQGGSAWFYSKAKIFSLKGEGVCDLIPCYRKSDGEIGMYNAINGEFLTNLGTGAFDKGPDV